VWYNISDEETKKSNSQIACFDLSNVRAPVDTPQPGAEGLPIVQKRVVGQGKGKEVEEAATADSRAIGKGEGQWGR
jgi:hypothetical protein